MQNPKNMELEICIWGRSPGDSKARSSMRRAEGEQVLTPDLHNSREFILAFVLMGEYFWDKYGASGIKLPCDEMRARL